MCSNSASRGKVPKETLFKSVLMKRRVLHKNFSSVLMEKSGSGFDSRVGIRRRSCGATPGWNGDVHYALAEKVN